METTLFLEKRCYDASDLLLRELLDQLLKVEAIFEALSTLTLTNSRTSLRVWWSLLEWKNSPYQGLLRTFKQISIL